MLALRVTIFAAQSNNHTSRINILIHKADSLEVETELKQINTTIAINYSHCSRSTVGELKYINKSEIIK